MFGARTCEQPSTSDPPDDVGPKVPSQTQTLIEELEALSTLFKGQGRSIPGYKNTLSRIRGEISKDKPGQHGAHYSRVWDIVKRGHGLVALHIEYKHRWDYVEDRKVPTAGDKKREKVLINAVLADGAEWLRVSNYTERELTYDLLNAGELWGEPDDSADEENSGVQPPGEEEKDDSDDDLKVVRQCKALIDQARHYRHHLQRPRVHLVFPKLETGKVQHVDDFLARLRPLGGEDVQVTVDDATSTFLSTPAPPYLEALANLANPLVEVTQTLNLYKDVIIALISDVSHNTLPPHQVDFEGRDKLEDKVRERQSHLINVVYPTITSRTLVCPLSVNKGLWKHMEIFRASDTEYERARVLFDTCEDSGQTLRKFRDLSSFPVPDTLRLPIRVDPDVDIDACIQAGTLPRASKAIQDGVTAECGQPGPINAASLLYGWATGCTSFATNAPNIRKFRRVIEQQLRDSGQENFRRPDLFFRFVDNSLRPFTHDAQWPGDWAVKERALLLDSGEDVT